MIRPDKNYRMSRAAKTKIALMCKTADERHHLKSMLIQAELSAESARRQALKSKGNKSKDVE
jgi:hypothetical protein